MKYVELWEKFQQLFKVFEISIDQALEGGWSKLNKISKEELLILFKSRFGDYTEFNQLEKLLE